MILIGIIAAIAGLAVGGAGAYMFASKANAGEAQRMLADAEKNAKHTIEEAEKSAKRTVDDANSKAEVIRERKMLEAKELFQELKSKHDEEINQR